jgi:hypothetical protein
VISPALDGCFGPPSSAALQASLRTAFFSLRQIVISSALGMNALQSLNTSGVHAMRCSGVPCKERACVTVVDSKAADTSNCDSISRSGVNLYLSKIIQLFMRAAIHVCQDARLSRNDGVWSFRRCRKLVGIPKD